MKLLAVAAIGVIALIGSPAVGAAKSELLTNSCRTILRGAEINWETAEILEKRLLDLGDKLAAAARENRSADSVKLNDDLKNTNVAIDGRIAVVADYAQIYSTFCK